MLISAKSVAQGLAVLAIGAATALGVGSCSRAKPADAMFARPEAAVRALNVAVKKDDVALMRWLFGAEADALLEAPGSETARRNRQIFLTAMNERWHLEDAGADKKVLVVGNEHWPFPVPLVKNENGWRFDTAAGKDEILARRIGRNELSVIALCRTYVAAQHLYARTGHDGKRAGIYATTFRSDPGKQNGLYWAAGRRQKRSPLGDLVTEAALETRVGQGGRDQRMPFHGYYFKILTAQGDAAPGGAKSWIVNGEMSGGFGLVAWPAVYGSTGVMTFVVSRDGVVHQQDLGAGTTDEARAMSLYDPDASWSVVQ
jgi:hypothetical protein